MLLGASSPDSRGGALWDAYKAHHGRDAGRTLVWQAPTWTMHPTITRADLDAEYEADPARTSAEYGALLRSDLEAFVSREVVEVAAQPGRHELPPVSGLRYVAFIDPSGGSVDSMTLGTAQAKEDGRAVLDAIRVKREALGDMNFAWSKMLKGKTAGGALKEGIEKFGNPRDHRLELLRRPPNLIRLQRAAVADGRVARHEIDSLDVTISHHSPLGSRS